MCAPEPRSFANAGGCPKSGDAGELGPSLFDDQEVTGITSHSSKTDVAREFKGKPSG